MSKLTSMGVAFIVLAACQSYPFVPYEAPQSTITATPTPGLSVSSPNGSLSGPVQAGVAVTDTFAVDSIRSTDVLFVIDSSGSMADKQARLASNAQQFINTLVASGNPFRIGIITTDIVDTAQQGRLHNMGNGALWLDAPLSTDPNAAAKGQALINNFVQTVTAVGTNGDSRESALYASMLALGVSDPVNTGVVTFNTGFQRSDADLAVIILSDEDDCSRTPAAGRITDWTPEQCYDQTLESQRFTGPSVVQALAQAKGGDVTRIRAGAIVAGITGSDETFTPVSCYTNGQLPASDCGCWSRSGSALADWYCEVNSNNGQPCAVANNGSCDAGTSCVDPVNSACLTQCSAMGGYRYDTFITTLKAARTAQSASDGTARGSICDASFSDVLTTIASNVVAPSCFTLPAIPDRNATLTVELERMTNSTLAAPKTIPELNPALAGACTTCGGACAEGSWTIAGEQICLGCGLFLLPGDQLSVTFTPSK